jgi:hypothetical protein
LETNKECYKQTTTEYKLKYTDFSYHLTKKSIPKKNSIDISYGLTSFRKPPELNQLQRLKNKIKSIDNRIDKINISKIH